MAIRDYYDWDNTVFDGVNVPEGIDRQLVINQIMMDCGLMDSYYITPSVFKMAVTQWFATHQWNFEHLIKIVNAEYSPIENTDRYDEYGITRNRNESEKLSQNREYNENTGSDMHSTGNVNEERNSSTEDTGTENTTDNLTNNTTVDGTTNSETTVSAFNSVTYQPDTKIEGSNKSTTEATTNETIKKDTERHGINVETADTSSNNTEERTESKLGSESAGSDKAGESIEKETYTQHLHGNIGVTTNQQMINEELALMKSFNIYQFISNMFMNDFCIMVW